MHPREGFEFKVHASEGLGVNSLMPEHFWRDTVFSAHSGGELRVAKIKGNPA